VGCGGAMSVVCSVGRLSRRGCVAWAWVGGRWHLPSVGLAGVVTVAGGGCWCGLSVAGSGGGGWAMCCVLG
jgi:hypothetical protein